jgi:hypothetical protein
MCWRCVCGFPRYGLMVFSCGDRVSAGANLSRPSATLPYEGRDQATSAALGATILAPLFS